MNLTRFSNAISPYVPRWQPLLAAIAFTIVIVSSPIRIIFWGFLDEEVFGSYSTSLLPGSQQFVLASGPDRKAQVFAIVATILSAVDWIPVFITFRYGKAMSFRGHVVGLTGTILMVLNLGFTLAIYPLLKHAADISVSTYVVSNLSYLDDFKLYCSLLSLDGLFILISLWIYIRLFWASDTRLPKNYLPFLPDFPNSNLHPNIEVPGGTLQSLFLEQQGGGIRPRQSQVQVSATVDRATEQPRVDETREDLAQWQSVWNEQFISNRIPANPNNKGKYHRRLRNLHRPYDCSRTGLAVKRQSGV
jgi:hypothetical protein